MLGPSQPLSNNFRRHSGDSPCQGLSFLFNIQISLFTHLGAVGVAKSWDFGPPAAAKQSSWTVSTHIFYIQTGWCNNFPPTTTFKAIGKMKYLSFKISHTETTGVWKEATAAMTALVYSILHTRIYRGYVHVYWPRVRRYTRRLTKRLSIGD